MTSRESSWLEKAKTASAVLVAQSWEQPQSRTKSRPIRKTGLLGTIQRFLPIRAERKRIARLVAMATNLAIVNIG